MDRAIDGEEEDEWGARSSEEESTVKKKQAGGFPKRRLKKGKDRWKARESDEEGESRQRETQEGYSQDGVVISSKGVRWREKTKGREDIRREEDREEEYELVIKRKDNQSLVDLERNHQRGVMVASDDRSHLYTPIERKEKSINKILTYNNNDLLEIRDKEKKLDILHKRIKDHAKELLKERENINQNQYNNQGTASNTSKNTSVVKKFPKSYNFKPRDYHNLECKSREIRSKTPKLKEKDKTVDFDVYEKRPSIPPISKGKNQGTSDPKSVKKRAKKIVDKLYKDAFKRIDKQEEFQMKYLRENYPFMPKITYLNPTVLEAPAGYKDQSNKYEIRLDGKSKNQDAPKDVRKGYKEKGAKEIADRSGSQVSSNSPGKNRSFKSLLGKSRPKAISERDSGDGFQKILVKFDGDISELNIDLDDEVENQRFADLKKALKTESKDNRMRRLFEEKKSQRNGRSKSQQRNMK